MHREQPGTWAEVRARLAARLPRLLIVYAAFYVFLVASNVFRRHRSIESALLVALIVEAIFTAGITILVGGFVLLLVKTRHSD